MKRKYELKYMTWVEADEAFRENRVVIIPMGSMEVHGPHSPVGDFILAEEVALEVAKRTDAIITPVVPFGVSEYFRGFPGTISVQNETLYRYVRDMVDCLVEHKVTKILLLNGHTGSAAALEQLSRRVRREMNIMIPRIDLWGLTPPALREEVFGPDFKKTGHGGGTVDTVMQYRHMDQMRMDLYDSGEERTKEWQAFSLSGLGKSSVNGSSIFLPTNMDDMSRQGSLGAPLLGSPEGGKKIFDFFVQRCSEVVDRMNASNMVLEEK